MFQESDDAVGALLKSRVLGQAGVKSRGVVYDVVV